VGVVISVFCFDCAMGNAYFRTARLSCCPLHVGQNDDCLQIAVDAYSVRLHFGRVRCKFFDVDCDCVSPIENHPCNVDKLLSDGCCLWSFCPFCDGGDELVELIFVN
jgi:hypothetical protein